MPNIVLKNRDGVPVEHPTDRVRLMMSDGNQQEFVNAGSVPVLVPANIELDFSGGDMEVVPENGNVFSGVTVIQPETLVPENIVKGISIAGIIGTSKAKPIIATGTIPAGTTKSTIRHDLGVVPDIIIVCPTATSGVNCLHAAVAFRRAFANLCGYSGFSLTKYTNSAGTTLVTLSTDHYLYTADGKYGWLANANKETFDTAYSSTFASIAPYVNTQWTAIGGLT